MIDRSRSSHWYLVFVLLLLLLLSGCSVPEADNVTPTPDVPPPVDTPDPDAPVGTPEPTIRAQAPITLQINSELKPAVDPICLEGIDDFSLRSAPFPEDGLEPGGSHIFCAVGAAEGAVIEFALVNPDGNEDIRDVISSNQDGAPIAPYSLALTANDKPGQWLLRASYDGESSEVGFTVIEPTRPFIALNQPLSENDSIVNAGIGGLSPGSTARFALYSLVDPRSTTGEAAQNDALLLISTRLVADDFGRADLELDVSDLPPGPYMLLLLPPGTDLDSPAVLQLPEQDHLMVATNLMRTAVAAGEEEIVPETETEVEVAEVEPQSPDGLSAPQLVQSPGIRPNTLQLSLPDLKPAPCLETDAVAVSIGPEAGEIGTWWRGCASGFEAGEKARIAVQMANGQTAIFNITAGLDGTAPFRWYGAPGEGSGETTVTVQGENGRASVSFDIGPATRPHAMVFPLDYQSNIGGDIYLTGFPAKAAVGLALYKLDSGGLGEKVKQWQVKTNANGNFSKPLQQAEGLETGRYVVIAQGGPTYVYPGLDTPSSAIAFFSYDVPPAPETEYYALHVGRVGEVIAAVAPTPTIAEPTATAEPTAVVEPTATAEPTPEPTVEAVAVEVASPTPEAFQAEVTPIPPGEAPAEIPPETYSFAVDKSAPVTCPNATPGELTICMLPDVLPRGTFGYMVMHDFKPKAKFTINVKAPNGKITRMTRKANADGYAYAYWYALNNERLGEYQVTIKGGGKTFKDNFTVVEPSTQHAIVQNRSTQPGTAVTFSVAGFEPTETVILARYLNKGTEGGELQFEYVDTKELKTGKGGGAQRKYSTKRGQKGNMYLILVYRLGDAEPITQVVYGVGQPLNSQYPFAWAQNYQEAQ